MFTSLLSYCVLSSTHFQSCDAHLCLNNDTPSLIGVSVNHILYQQNTASWAELSWAVADIKPFCIKCNRIFIVYKLLYQQCLSWTWHTLRKLSLLIMLIRSYNKMRFLSLSCKCVRTKNTQRISHCLVCVYKGKNTLHFCHCFSCVYEVKTHCVISHCLACVYEVKTHCAFSHGLACAYEVKNTLRISLSCACVRS